MSSQEAQNGDSSTLNPKDEREINSKPSLLPAFEPTSSSPSLPAPRKRKYDGSPCNRKLEFKHYPTPVPTSSTAILASSPSQQYPTRPGLLRTTSTASERVPLGALPSVEIPSNGEPLLMGRSSNSSHYQLSACRLISRVHVRGTYQLPDEQHEHGKIIIECLGWNGVNVHCRGRKLELGKGDTFTSDKPHAEVMLDVQDARVLIRWPASARQSSATGYADTHWDEADTPEIDRTPVPSSPPQIQLQSPISPSPRNRNNFSTSATFLGLPSISPDHDPVQVYEDNTSGEDPVDGEITAEPAARKDLGGTDASAKSVIEEPTSSPLSEVEDNFSDHNEENDPIVHSFGPFGDNLLPRIAGINASSPERRRHPLRASVSPQQGTASGFSAASGDIELSPIRNHVINQLAFSRLHSLPISTILTNLPASLTHRNTNDKDSEIFSHDQLKKLLDDTPCVGEIIREGKDAAGKALEDEFYYVPEMDADEMRRNAVEAGLGKTGLRSVRKQHKQYYWKRPRN